MQAGLGWVCLFSACWLCGPAFELLHPYNGFVIFRQLNFVAQVLERNPPNKRFRNLNFIVG
jgi:hypothetical protein